MMCSDRIVSKEQWYDEVYEVFKRAKSKYELCEDLFTGTVCTTKEWVKNSLEYDKQLMIQRYGYCDGVD